MLFLVAHCMHMAVGRNDRQSLPERGIMPPCSSRRDPSWDLHIQEFEACCQSCASGRSDTFLVRQLCLTVWYLLQQGHCGVWCCQFCPIPGCVSNTKLHAWTQCRPALQCTKHLQPLDSGNPCVITDCNVTSRTCAGPFKSRR